MKKLTALFLALLLLTACGQGMTAYAEDYEYEEESGDGYDEWTEDDEWYDDEEYDDEWYDDEEYDDEWYDDEYDETYMSGQGYSEEDDDYDEDEDDEYWDLDEMDTEPQIWITEDEYDEELYEKFYGKEEQLDTSAIPAEIEDEIIYTARTTFATIAISNHGSIYYIQNGKITEHWVGGVTGEKDIIFDASEIYPDADYRWYGYVGGTFYGFSDSNPVKLINKCDEFSYTGKAMYSFSLIAATLEAFSPYGKIFITNDAREFEIVNGYVFLRCRSGIYVVNASPYALCSMKQEYLDEHGVPLIRLDDAGAMLSDYSGQLNINRSYNAGKSEEELADAFDAKYGTDFSKWGNPRYDFKIEDLDLMNGLEFQQVYNNYDIGKHDKKGSYLDLEFISCGDYSGNLHYKFNNGGTVSSVKYEALNCGEADFEEFRAYLQRAGGTELVEFTLAPNADTGYIYKLGDKRIYLEYTEETAGSSGIVSISMVYGS